MPRYEAREERSEGGGILAFISVRMGGGRKEGSLFKENSLVSLPRLFCRPLCTVSPSDSPPPTPSTKIEGGRHRIPQNTFVASRVAWRLRVKQRVRFYLDHQGVREGCTFRGELQLNYTGHTTNGEGKEEEAIEEYTQKAEGECKPPLTLEKVFFWSSPLSSFLSELPKCIPLTC